MKYQQHDLAFSSDAILAVILAALASACSKDGTGSPPSATGGATQTSTGTGGAVATGGAVVGTGGQGGTGMGQTGGAPGGFLHVEGNKLLDWRGKTVRLTGVNWFGLETNNQEPHGVWTRDYRSMVKQIADLGFNTIRLPWANQILRDDAKASDANSFGKSGPDPYDGTNPINEALVGKSPLEIMDKVIEAAGDFGLKIVLDNHSREPDGYMNEQVWYTDKTSEQQWIDDWVFLAKRYAGNPTVVAADLDNEPHGQATWGAGDAATDWNTAAEKCGNAILAANPDWVIVVEGTEKVGSDGYWWGGNLSGVKSKPIKLSDPSKLMYSAHEYGPEVHDQPWFSDASFPNNLTRTVDRQVRLHHAAEPGPHPARRVRHPGPGLVGRQGRCVVRHRDGQAGQDVLVDLLVLEPQLGRHRGPARLRLVDPGAVEDRRPQAGHGAQDRGVGAAHERGSRSTMRVL